MKTTLLLFFLMFAPTNLSNKPVSYNMDSLSWMVGSWGGEKDGTEMEEYWIPAKGGMMLGLHRDVNPHKNLVFFEYLRIEKNKNGIFYTASPNGHSATSFVLKELSGLKAVFENPKHDFPQRIIYQLEGDDILIVRIEGMGEKKHKFQEWRWKRK